MRNYVVISQFDYSGVPWTGGTPIEQGYNVLPLPNLRRPAGKDNAYFVYKNETEYQTIEADSVVSAIVASQIESPHKVTQAHGRIGDVIETTKLEYTGKNSAYMEKHGFKGTDNTPAPDLQETEPAEPFNKDFINIENDSSNSTTKSLN